MSFNTTHNLIKRCDGIMDPEIWTGREPEIRYTDRMMRKQYTAAFKAKVVQELLREEKGLAQIASEYEVHPTQLKNWRAIAIEGLSTLFEKQDSVTGLKEAYEQQLTDLYAEIGRLTTQLNWLKKKCQV
jgi:putative transposase